MRCAGAYYHSSCVNFANHNAYLAHLNRIIEMNHAYYNQVERTRVMHVSPVAFKKPSTQVVFKSKPRRLPSPKTVKQPEAKTNEVQQCEDNFDLSFLNVIGTPILHREEDKAEEDKAKQPEAIEVNGDEIDFNDCYTEDLAEESCGLEEVESQPEAVSAIEKEKNDFIDNIVKDTAKYHKDPYSFFVEVHNLKKQKEAFACRYGMMQDLTNFTRDVDVRLISFVENPNSNLKSILLAKMKAIVETKVCYKVENLWVHEVAGFPQDEYVCTMIVNTARLFIHIHLMENKVDAEDVNDFNRYCSNMDNLQNIVEEFDKKDDLNVIIHNYLIKILFEPFGSAEKRFALYSVIGTILYNGMFTIKQFVSSNSAFFTPCFFCSVSKLQFEDKDKDVFNMTLQDKSKNEQFLTGCLPCLSLLPSDKLVFYRLNKMIHTVFTEKETVLVQLCAMIYLSFKHQVTYVDYVSNPIRFLLMRSSGFWEKDDIFSYSSDCRLFLTSVLNGKRIGEGDVIDEYGILSTNIVSFGLQHIHDLRRSKSMINAHNGILQDAVNYCCLCLPSKRCCICKHFQHVNYTMDTLEKALNRVSNSVIYFPKKKSS